MPALPQTIFDDAPTRPGETALRLQRPGRASYRLERAGVPLVPDLEEAWADWAGWRVNYDLSVIALSTVTSAPPNDTYRP